MQSEKKAMEMTAERDAMREEKLQIEQKLRTAELNELNSKGQVWGSEQRISGIVQGAVIRNCCGSVFDGWGLNSWSWGNSVFLVSIYKANRKL